MWKQLDREVYKSWVEAIINEASDKLSDWENSFIESIEFFPKIPFFILRASS